MSRGLRRVPGGPHTRSPSARPPQGSSASCSSSTCCSPASGSSPCSTWPGSSSTGTRRRRVRWPCPCFCPRFLQLCSRTGVGVPLSPGPSQNMGSPTSPCSFPPLPCHQHHGGKRVAVGLQGAFPLDPAACWDGLGWLGIIFWGPSRLCRWQEAAVPAAMDRVEALSGLFPSEGTAPGRGGSTQKEVPPSYSRDSFCPRSW